MPLDRRRFIALAGPGLALGLLPHAGPAADAHAAAISPAAANGLAQTFVRIAADGWVTVVIKHLEMGQGISTGLATVVADELDADWSRVRTVAAAFDPPRYKHTLFGWQTTGGSTSMANSWQQLREAGATARAMLVAAAAQRWGVPIAQLTTHRSRVFHAASGRQAGYGELAGAAAALPVPSGVPLKTAASRHLIGRAKPRLGQAEAASGRVSYGIDMRRPGMGVVVLQRSPRFGGRVGTLDAAAALAMPGVRGVHRLETAVAVVADDTWRALQARNQLVITWDDSQAEQRSSPALWAEFRRLADSGQPGVDALLRGRGEAALADAAQVLEAEFEQPYLAHQAMEPITAVGEWGEAGCDLWCASQNVTADHAAAMRLLGLKPELVRLHVLPAGGSFGRRATFSADWMTELCTVLKARREAGDRRPVQLLWTREDDITGGYYRPMSLHRMRAGLDAQGRLLAVRHTVVAQSFSPRLAKGEAPTRIDPFAVEGHLAERYDVPHALCRWVNPKVGVPVHTYRALGYNHSTFCKEVLMDELAQLAGQDALAFRLAHLQGHGRQAAALAKAAQMAGWGQPQPTGRELGLAVQEAYGTVVAQVVRARLQDGAPVAEQVWCVVDCGTVVDPDIVRSQMEGGVAFGLSIAIYGGLSLEDGQVQQRNFHDAPVLRLPQTPAVHVVIVDSSAPPTGVGEPGSVPIVPAIANAFARLSGQRVRRLPLHVD
ncbi:xanthine dehydrogenase family protein molybdopterin-binding subunit [Aquabacterium sp. OR-4]|uniref:xanthine dehydrogenase family protein molybdopterin-binding subunit n=1 Tax=Aquabacterium sp. OR-4 TaxID=2978127 RepID=UPI0021B32E6F|nr:molybdopterin cofactor-binding domain-containing protein [Aquabacterium sp. OR-4]MDT7836925.1 molybdopterin cofactor-binding domain-containing protein [Aquabacterium sp. OR-4]